MELLIDTFAANIAPFEESKGVGRDGPFPKNPISNYVWTNTMKISLWGVRKH